MPGHAQRLGTLRPPRRSDRELVPRFLLRAVGALILACLVLVTYARVTNMPLSAVPGDGPIAKERTIVIYSDMSGRAQILDLNGEVVATLPPDQGGFISGVSRALARERTKYSIAADAPVRLVQYADGQLALHDTQTPWRAQLIGFGADNAAAFRDLLKD